MVDPVRLNQALVNLVDNSIAATPAAGTIEIAARTVDTDIVIQVVDSGEGLPTEDVETLLQPFFSTKGRGSGVGLAIVHRIVTEHGGTLTIASRPTGGAVATMTLVGALVSSESTASP
jgi:signal transduction histidine kinase